jgi:pimeloyl-ACP methyl ester carboxylesterase
MVIEHRRTITMDDSAVIAYGICRADRPRRLMVLIHGMASNMTRWSEFLEETTLSGSWDLLRLDLRGHARSAYRGPVGMERWCDDVAAILDREGYGRAVLGGHCLGANIALQFAHRYPERTAGLVLIEPMPRRALTGTLRKLRPYAPVVAALASVIRALNRLGLRRRRIPALDLRELDRATRRAVHEAGTTEAMMKRYAVPWHDLRYLPSAIYLREFLEVIRPLPPLESVTAPVLALLSSGAYLSDPAITQTVLAALPRCRIEVLDSRHWIPTEQPEEMRRIIEQWCAETFGD